MKRFIVAILILLTIGSCYSPHPNALFLSKINNIEVLFFPNGGIKDRIIDAINQSETAISITMFTFTDDEVDNEIADALITRTKKTGVKIRLIVDTTQAGKFKIDEYLEKNGIDVKRRTGIRKDNGRGIMHHKFIIFDDTLLMTGSYNLTANAEKYSYENAIFISDESIIKKYQEEFEELWREK